MSFSFSFFFLFFYSNSTFSVRKNIDGECAGMVKVEHLATTESKATIIKNINKSIKVQVVLLLNN
jgi:hypothetical protein